MSMSEQRSGGRSRRRFLHAASAAGLVAVAGCLGGDGGDGGNDSGGGDSNDSGGNNDTGGDGGSGSGNGNDTGDGDGGDGGQSMSMYIMSAGSLNNALLTDFKSAVDVPVKIESDGSATVAREIAEGIKDPDIVALADTALFHQPLTPPWYSVFTSNAVVIAVNKDTKWGSRVAEAGADGWYKPMVDGNVALGRTPPDQDPLGYRTLFTLDLSSRYYEDAKNLREKIPKKGQIYPETSMLSRFETGAIDAAFVYRNMATERDYPYIDLPNKIDLSSPKYVDEWYSKTSYTLSNGKTIQGDLIAYGATIRHPSEAALEVFDVLTTGSYLTDHGFILREQFPEYKGNVPQRVKQGVSTKGEADPEASGNQSTSGTQSSMRSLNLSPEISEIRLLL